MNMRYFLVLALFLSWMTAPATAAVVVQSGTVVTTATPPLPPGTPLSRASDVNVVSLDASIGQSYNNFYGNAVNTTNAPFLAGGIRSIGSDILTNYNLRTGGSTPATFTITGVGTFQIVAVFAFDGAATGGGASAFTATSGRLGFFLITPGTYNQFDPLTWGATDATGATLNAPLAVWDLTSPAVAIDLGPAAPGGGGPGTYNNLLISNSVTFNAGTAALTQGLFITQESTTFSSPAPLIGNEYDNIYANPPLAAPPEGFVATLNEVVNQAPSMSFVSSPFGFAAMNTIASALGGLANLGGAGTAWATGIAASGSPGTAATDFSANTALPNTADLVTNLGLQLSIYGQVTIPEPGSMVAWALGLAACGGWRRYRRGKARVA